MPRTSAERWKRWSRRATPPWPRPGVEQKVAAENMLTGALRQLFALSESYPDLKANQNFQQLQSELSDIENKLAAARRFFNNAVQEYNTGIQQFPAVLFAGIFGFSQREFFDVGEDRAPARAGAEREVLNVSASADAAWTCPARSCTTRRAARRPLPGEGQRWPPTVSTRISSPTSAARSRC